MQLTPHPVYGTSISLACTGLPAGAACNFTSNPVTLQGPGSSTLNITTTARPIVTPAASLLTRQFYAIWLVVPGLTLLGVGVGGERRRRRIVGMFCSVRLFALLLLLPACSSKQHASTGQRNACRELHDYRYCDLGQRHQEPDDYADGSVKFGGTAKAHISRARNAQKWACRGPG